MNTTQDYRSYIASAAAIIFGLATAVAAFCAGCSREQGGPAIVSRATGQTSSATELAADASVPVFAATSGQLRQEVELSATVEGYETAQLMSKVAGYVGEVTVNIGDPIQKGELLAELDLPELADEVERQQRLIEQAEALVCSRQADVALAEARLAEHDASLRMKRSEKNRVARLVSRGSLNQQQLDEATYALEAQTAMKASAQANIAAVKAKLESSRAATNVAKAELRKAESMARYSKITAPFDGIITARMIDSGAFVQPAGSGAGTSLFTITRVDKVRIAAFIPMDEAGSLDVGDPVEIRSIQSLPDMNLGQLDLSVSRISRSFDKESRMMRAEIDVDNEQMKQNTNSVLTPGDYVRLAVVLNDVQDALVVPAAAVGSGPNGPFVGLVDANNRCAHMPVTILQRDGDTVAISSANVSPGDTLLSVATQVPDQTQLTSDQIVRQ